jgi:hypothetical protein
MSKVNVSRRALEGRVKRGLEKDGQMLKKCRVDSRWYNELGDHYIVDINTNSVVEKHTDLEALARESGALKDYEVLSAE